MSHGGVCAHINTELCVQRAEGEENGIMGPGIQLTGTSFQYHLEGDYPVCRDKRRGKEGQMRNRSRKVNTSEVRDKRIGSASSLNR